MFDALAASVSLSVLIGQPFTSVGRTLDMAVFSFGEDLEWIDSRGNPQVGGRYALHVQCPFRVAGMGRILTGSEDIRWIQDRALPEDERTTFDRQRKLLNEALAVSRSIVTDATVTGSGDIRIKAGEYFAVEVFPASARTDEAWRFLERYGEHLVFPTPE